MVGVVCGAIDGNVSATSNPENYHGAVSGFLAEVDRMELEVREYLSIHPAELASTGT